MPKQLVEKLINKGGENGDVTIADPVEKKATLPNSKDQGEKTNPLKTASDLQAETPSNGTGSAASNKASVNNKPSQASAETVDDLSKFSKEDFTMEVAFEGEDLSEEFKEKAATIFEAAVAARTQVVAAELEEQYNQKLEEQLSQFTAKVSDQIDSYLNYVVEQWMEENELAIESSLRTEITEEFINGMKNLFAENYIEIPEDKFDVIEELANKVESLEAKLNETLEENITMSNEIKQKSKEMIVATVAESLSLAQREKFLTLADGVDYTDDESFVKKLNIVKENYFDQKKIVSNIIESEVDTAEEINEDKKPSFDPLVSRYMQAISRTAKK